MYEEEYEVENIILHHDFTFFGKEDTKRLYLVKWANYPLSQSTWEPLINLFECGTFKQYLLDNSDTEYKVDKECHDHVVNKLLPPLPQFFVRKKGGKRSRKQYLHEKFKERKFHECPMPSPTVVSKNCESVKNKEITKYDETIVKEESIKFIHAKCIDVGYTKKVYGGLGKVNVIFTSIGHVYDAFIHRSMESIDINLFEGVKPTPSLMITGDNIQDFGDVIMYTPKKKNYQFLDMNLKLKIPVRIVRSNIEGSRYTPSTGYIYSGLYFVTKKSKPFFSEREYRLVRGNGQVPLWEGVIKKQVVPIFPDANPSSEDLLSKDKEEKFRKIKGIMKVSFFVGKNKEINNFPKTTDIEFEPKENIFSGGLFDNEEFDIDNDVDSLFNMDFI